MSDGIHELSLFLSFLVHVLLFVILSISLRIVMCHAAVTKDETLLKDNTSLVEQFYFLKGGFIMRLAIFS